MRLEHLLRCCAHSLKQTTISTLTLKKNNCAVKGEKKKKTTTTQKQLSLFSD